MPPIEANKKRFDYGKVIGIFLGAVWAYILFFLFWGPEMSAEEREEEAEAAKYLENLRSEGVSLAEIGVVQARKAKGAGMPPRDNDEEKGNEAITEHIE